MPLIQTDQRSIETRPEPEAHRRIVRRLPEWLAREVELADDFARIQDSSTWAEWGCASVVEFGTRHGYRGAQVKAWVLLGKAMREVPPLRAAVLEQRTPIEHAEIIAPVLLEPALVEERAEWLDLSERTSARRLRSYVARRLEQVRQAETALEPLTIWTTRRTKREWRRACDIACSRAHRTLSEGEVFATVVGHYLDSHDPVRRAVRLERMDGAARQSVPDGDLGREEDARAPTPSILDATWLAAPPEAAPAREASGTHADAEPRSRTDRTSPPGSASGHRRPFDGPSSGVRRPRRGERSRHVRAATERKLWLRSGGVCEVPGCESRRNLQMCHIRAWSRGGGNGPWNLVLLCPRHHTLFDAGALRFLRWSRGGRPTFKGPDGRVLHPEARAPPPGLGAG